MKQNVGTPTKEPTKKHTTSRKRSAKPPKRITIQQYNAKMDQIMAAGLPVHEILVKMLEFAPTVKIVEKKQMTKRKVYCEACRWLGFMAMGGTGMLGTERYDICSHMNSIDKYPPDSPQDTKNQNNDCKDFVGKDDIPK